MYLGSDQEEAVSRIASERWKPPKDVVAGEKKTQINIIETIILMVLSISLHVHCKNTGGNIHASP